VPALPKSYPSTPGRLELDLAAQLAAATMARLADRTFAEHLVDLDQLEPYDLADGHYDDEMHRSRTDEYVAD
jgi:hypothetical protein